MIGNLSIISSLLITTILFFIARIGNPQIVHVWTFLAKITGLFASILISWNFILAIRLPFLEKMFGGLDKVYRVHNILGQLGFIIVVNHPLFLILDSLPFNTSKLYLLPNISNLPYTFGILGLYSLITLLVLTIFIDLPYKLWKKTHEVMGLVIIFGGLHGLLITSDTSNYLPLKIWIVGFSILGLLSYIYKRYIYYLIKPKNNYIVTNITHEKSYLLIEMESVDPNKFITFKSGQFAFFSRNDDPRDEHPFSILEQNGKNIKIGAKVIGKFTINMTNLKIGDKFNVYGPFGSFSNDLHKAKNIVFISGGIGITPFLSMFKDLKDGQNATIIHTCRSEEPKLFTDMFNKNNQIVHCSNEAGHLNVSHLAKYANLSADTYVFICGPTQMMEDLSNSLPSLGIKQKHIIYEDFNLK